MNTTHNASRHVLIIGGGIGGLAAALALARKGIRITWGYYFRVGIVLTLPVLLVPLAALAVRLSVG